MTYEKFSPAVCDAMVLFNFKRPDLVRGEDACIVIEEEYNTARARLSHGALRCPIYSARRKMYGDKLSDAIKNLVELRRIENLARKENGENARGEPLAEVMFELIDYALGHRSHFLHDPYHLIVISPGEPGSLFSQLYGILGVLLLDYLVPEVSGGEKAALGRALHSRDPLDDAVPLDEIPADEDMDSRDTGDEIETEPSQAEAGAVRRINAREAERSVAVSQAAELLAGYPKEIIDLAYAMGEHGQIKVWAREHGVPHGTALRWAKELREEVLGTRTMYAGYWDDVSARCERAALKAHPPEQHGQWAWGQRTDAQSGHSTAGLIHSGEIPSGYVNIDRDVAAVYYLDLRRG